MSDDALGRFGGARSHSRPRRGRPHLRPAPGGGTRLSPARRGALAFGAAAAGLLLALIATVSLNLPLQRAPLALALPALALFGLTLAAPDAGLLAALFLVPLVPILGNLVPGPDVAPAELALLACGAGLLLSPRAAPPSPPTLLLSALAVSAAAGALGGVAATLAALPPWALPGALASLAHGLHSVLPQDAAAPLRAAALHALPLAAYVAVRRLAPARRARALALLVGAVALAGIWSVAEAAGGPHLWPPAAYDSFARFGRSVSTLGDHNAAAALFVLFLFPAAAYALARRGAARVAGGAAAALIAAGLLLSGSRTAWLFAALAALAVAARGLLGTRALRAALLAGGAAALLAAAALLLPGTSGSVVRERISSLAPLPAMNVLRYGRVPFWRTGMAMIAAHPLSGVGPGRVPSAFASYRPAGLAVPSENLHSWPLQCFAENGVVGGALLLLPFAALAPLLKNGARLLRGGEGALVPGLAASAVSGFVSHPWLLAEVQVLFWGAAALLEGAVADAAPREPAREMPRSLRWASIALLALWGLPLVALAPGRDAGRFGYGTWGFDEGEGRYEWIGPEAALWLPRPAAGAPLSLAVRRPEAVPATDGVVVAARAGFGPWRRVLPADTGWTELTVPPGGRVGEGLLVELRASRAFCPAAQGSGDRRILSFQLRKP